MTKLANTIAFASMLDRMGIVPRVEIDITTDQQPEVSDVYPILLAARRLVEHGIAIDMITVADGNMDVAIHIPLSDYKGGWLKLGLMFDNGFSLINTTAELDINRSEELVHVFDNIDIAMFLPVSTILSYLANCIYTMLFGSAYITGVQSMLALNYIPPTVERSVCVNGQAYTTLPVNGMSVIDQETGIVDLILVQAFQLTSQFPEVGNFDLVVDIENATLCFASE